MHTPPEDDDGGLWPLTGDPTPGRCTACGRRSFRRGLCITCYRHARTRGLIDVKTLRRHQDVVDDVEWLLDAGETHPDTITARLDYTSRNSLYSALKRAGRDDLIDKLKQGDVR